MLQKKALSASMIALINVCAITNIKNFPLLAEYGLSILLFLALSSISLLHPCRPGFSGACLGLA